MRGLCHNLISQVLNPSGTCRPATLEYRAGAMISYSKTTWGLHLLFRWYGSAIPRALPFSLLSAVMTCLLFIFKTDQFHADWRHPYPFLIYANVVGFLVVFRSQQSYGRYTDGRTKLQIMTARWSDFCIQTMYMDAGNLPKDLDADPKACQAATWFVENLTHLVSLMHALAVQHLRGDWQLDNLQPHSGFNHPPPLDAAGLPPSGQGYRHRFSLASFFMLRGTLTHMKEYNAEMPLPVIGDVSIHEQQSLGRDLQGLSSDQTETLMSGLDHNGDRTKFIKFLHSFQLLSTGIYVPGAAERVNICYAWIQQLLQQRMRMGGLATDAPILSREWQLLSEGMLAFEQCRALADTPFPFPFAQMVLSLLVILAFTAPLMIVAFVESLWLAIVIDLIVVQSYWSMNEVSRDLEDPFVYDPNDLPLARYQYQLNQRILAAAKTRRPVSSYDQLRGQPDSCMSTFAPILYHGP